MDQLGPYSPDLLLSIRQKQTLELNTYLNANTAQL